MSRISNIVKRTVSVMGLFPVILALPAWTAQVPSAVTLLSGVDPSYQGEAVPLTVHAFEPAQALTGTPPIATGTVTISVTCPGNTGGVPDATYSGVLDATGVWTTTVSTWPCTGGLRLQAIYPGDVNFLPGSSTQLIQTVNATAVPVSLTFVPAPFVFTAGTTFQLGVNFTYTLTNLTRPSGSVTFTNTSVTPPTTATGLVITGAGTKTITSAAASWNLPAGTYTMEAYYPGDNIYGPATAFVNITVNGTSPSPTGTTLVASASTINLGQPVTFTAGVTSPAGGSPVGTNGSVTFAANGIALGTVPLDVNGQATLTTSSLGVGSNTITAQYSGAGNYQQSTSPGVTVLVQTPSTTTTVTSSPNPATANVPFQLIATVTPAGATGTVTFSSSPPLPATYGAPVPLQPIGGVPTAILSVSLPAGTYTVTGAFNPSNPIAFGASVSSPYAAVVNQPAATATQTSISSSANPSVYGQLVTFSMAVTGTSSLPTGQIGLSAGPITATLTLDNSGHATFTTGALPVGSNNVIAVYQGDTLNQGSTSPTLVQGVTQDSAATVLTSSANPSAYGQPVTFTAMVTANAPGAGTPTGTVTFMDGASTLGAATLSGGTATFSTSALAVATHSITAVYSGDGNFTGSTSNAVSQAVGRNPSATTLTSSVNPSAYGQPVTFTATVTGSGGTPTGTVTFMDGASTLGAATLSGGQATFSTSALAVATHSITAVYGGDVNFTGSTSNAVSQAVGRNPSATTLTSSVNPSVYGQPVTFTATVTGSGGTPTGTVTLMDGASTLGAATLSGGQATYSTSALAVATHAITAVYGGDVNFTGSTSNPVSQAVGQDSTATTLASSANPSVYGQSVTFTASVAANAPGAGTPTGTVTFMDGASTLGAATLSGGHATYSTSALGVATHTITARYGSDGNFTASASAALSQVTNKAATRTTLTSSLNPAAVGQAVTFTATVKPVAPGAGTPTGSVIFAFGSATTSAAVSPAGTAAWTTSTLPAGTDVVTATYGGDASFQSSSATLNETETAAPPPGAADLFISNQVDNRSVSSGDWDVYTLFVSNQGPGAASSVVVTDNLPAGTVFQSLEVWMPAGMTCTTPKVGQTGALVCTRTSWAAKSWFGVSIVVKITAPNGSTISNTATVASATPDPNPANNSSTVAISVKADK
jgi:uncharacterized repeat protein (TIGR01451 family)